MRGAITQPFTLSSGKTPENEQQSRHDQDSQRQLPACFYNNRSNYTLAKGSRPQVQRPTQALTPSTTAGECTYQEHGVLQLYTLIIWTAAVPTHLAVPQLFNTVLGWPLPWTLWTVPAPTTKSPEAEHQSFQSSVPWLSTSPGHMPAMCLIMPMVSATQMSPSGHWMGPEWDAGTERMYIETHAGPDTFEDGWIRKSICVHCFDTSSFCDFNGRCRPC